MGGDATEQAAVGNILGRGVTGDEVPDALEKLLNVYVERRESADEPFLEAFRRLGEAPFKEALYG